MSLLKTVTCIALFSLFPIESLYAQTTGLDSDQDHMDDGLESFYFGDLTQEGRDDFDGDRYPNIYEMNLTIGVRSDPSDPIAVPSVTATVNASNSLADALAIATDPYDVIVVEPSFPGPPYTGPENTGLILDQNVLIISEATSTTTVFDGQHQDICILVTSPAAIVGLTFKDCLRQSIWVESDGVLVADSEIYGARFPPGETIGRSPAIAVGNPYGNIPVRDFYVRNTIMRDNEAVDHTGALYVNVSDPNGYIKIHNCTFFNNRVRLGPRTAIGGSFQFVDMKNSIIWDDYPGDAVQFSGTSFLALENNVLEGFDVSDSNNLNQDPLLSPDGRLGTSASPAIDAGVDVGIHTDIDAEARPLGRSDIGADEFGTEPPTCMVILPLVCPDGELSVACQPVEFPPTPLAGQDVIVEAIDATWTATDTTCFGAGWHVTLIADDHLRGNLDPINHIIEIGASRDFLVNCLDSEIVTVSGDAVNLPTCTNGPQAIPVGDENPITVIYANRGNGMGVYDFLPHFEILVPGTTIIDTYTTDIWVDIMAGP